MHRVLPFVLPLALLAACASPAPEEDHGPTTDTLSAAVDTTPAYAWIGYYTDTLPCADCPGTETTLWVRNDSTFVLQERSLDRDTLPKGSVGTWHVENHQLVLSAIGERPERWRAVARGVERVGANGEPIKADRDLSLEKLADAVGDAIPSMLLTGDYTFSAGAHSFQPNGSRFVWPCVAGMDMGEEEGEPLVKFTNADLLREYRNWVKTDGERWTIEVVCTLGMGPAMEGDGADEYVFIERVVRAVPR